MPSFESLRELIARQNQRFVCHGTGWPESGPRRFSAAITHEISPPVPESILDQIRAQIPAVPQLVDLYSQFGSIRLYCDAIGDDSAFYLASPGEWNELGADLQPWLDMVADEDPEDFPPPDWGDDFIVIGEIPGAANYFLVPLHGSQVGAVVEFDHDGHEYTVRGRDIASFIDYLAVVTPALIEGIGAHTRYSDGQTNTQWLPESYQHG